VLTEVAGQMILLHNNNYVVIFLKCKKTLDKEKTMCYNYLQKQTKKDHSLILVSLFCKKNSKTYKIPFFVTGL